MNGLSKEEIAVNVNEAPRRVVTGHDKTGKAIVVIDARCRTRSCVKVWGRRHA